MPSIVLESIWNRQNKSNRGQWKLDYIKHKNNCLGNAYDGPQVEIWALGEQLMSIYFYFFLLEMLRDGAKVLLNQSKRYQFLQQTQIFLSLYLCNPMQ